MAKVSLPNKYFPDPDRGRPLFNASIYIGQPGTDPEVAINQVPVSLVQGDGTSVSVPQPIKTGAGGVPMYMGSPAAIEVANNISSYSIKVLDASGAQAYYTADSSPSSTIAETQAAIDTDVTNRLVEKYSSVGAINLASLPSGQRISTRSYIEQDIANGGAEYDILTLQEVRDAKGDPAWVPDGYVNHSLANGNVALFAGQSITLAQAGGDSRTATRAAFDSGLRLELSSGETAILGCDPTSGDDFQAMSLWLAGLHKPADATAYLELADGVHTVSTYLDLDGPTAHLDIRATSAPDFIQITSYSYSSVSGDIYDCTVTVDTALPSGAVVGGPIGIQNAQGTLDVACANGCQTIKSIAGDRLSFVFEITSTAGAPSNGVLDNTLTYGLVANQAVVFKGSLIAQSTGWDGTSREGFINCLNGATINARYFGIAYSGAANTEHDLIFLRGEGSRFYAFDRMGFSGAGDKVLRSFSGTEFYLNRSYVGGSSKAQELYQGSGGGHCNFIRCSTGSASIGGLTAGNNTTITFSQGIIACANNGVRPTQLGASIGIFPARIHKNVQGILNTSGFVYGDTSTEITRNTTGIAWDAQGITKGNFTMSGNTTDAVAAGNTWHEGGVWFQNTTANAAYTSFDQLTIDAAIPVLSFIDGAATATIEGDAGNLKLDAYTANRDVILSAAGVNELRADFSARSWQGEVDNDYSLGTASFRWSEVFAANGAINTSDKRLKQDVRDLTVTEQAVAQQIKGMIKAYKFTDAVDKKGPDGARIHFGVMAQDVGAVFTAHGLDPHNYSLFCYDEWEDIVEGDGTVRAYAGNRYGIRYEELLAFIISAM